MRYDRKIRTSPRTSGLLPGHQEAHDDPGWLVFPLLGACRDHLSDDLTSDAKLGGMFITDQIL